MKKTKRLLLGIFSLTFLIGIQIGCGTVNDNIGLSIDPSGPTAVQKGDTLQFSVEPNIPVTWSVEGGATNGTIDATGLYTPPANLPINPEVTIRADGDGGTFATATVMLKTGETIAFTAGDQINDTPIPGIVFAAEVTTLGNTDRISARLGSLHVHSVWTNWAAGKYLGLFDKDTDFLGFGTDLDFIGDPTKNYLAGTVVTNSSLNPGIVTLFEGATAIRLGFSASGDQGDSFGAIVPVDPTDPGDDQYQPTARIDANDVIHLAFAHESTASGTGYKIRYVKSEDGGATWSTAKDISPDASDQKYPSLAVSDDGQTVLICYMDDSGVGTQDIFLAKSADGGQNFALPVPVTVTTTARLCRVAMGPEGNVYVSYSDNGDLWVRKSVDLGNSFQPDQKVNNDATHVSTVFHVMGVDSLGRVDFVWQADIINDGNADDLMYTRSIDEAGSFLGNLPIDGNGTETAVFPTGLDHDASGRAHIQYLSNKNGGGANFDIFYGMGE